MRRKDREVTEFSELLSIIKKCDACTIALNNDEYPYLIPLNFGVEAKDGRITLYFHSAQEGTKLELIKKNPHASFSMHCEHLLEYFPEQGYCTMSYESVIGKGTIVFVEKEEEKLHGLRLIMNQFHPEDAYFHPAAIPRTTVYKLVVESMSGKRKTPKKNT